MKVLVWSDSHGAYFYVERMLNKEPDCKTVFFLGDGMKEAEKARELFPDRTFIFVKGNNDSFYNAESFAYKHIDGVTLMACHGDTLSVRVTLNELYRKAEAVRAHIALYGHTHIPKTATSYSGVCAVNPGALCNGKYCVIEIEKGDFTVTHKEV